MCMSMYSIDGEKLSQLKPKRFTYSILGTSKNTTANSPNVFDNYKRQQNKS